jgi:hypothetical protein
MTVVLTADAVTEAEAKYQPQIALYNRNDRLVGVVRGWRVADGVMDLDANIRRAVATEDLTHSELVEVDEQIARLRKMRGTL